MEENNEKKMSAFCEKLMEVTGSIGKLTTDKDCAILLCSDGSLASKRIAGSGDNLEEMLFKVLSKDPILMMCFVNAVEKATREYVAISMLKA